MTNKRGGSTDEESNRRAGGGTNSSTDSDNSALDQQLVAGDADERPKGPGQVKPSGAVLEALRALQNFKLPDSTVAAIQAMQNYKLPDSTVAAIQAMQNYKLPDPGITSISALGLREWEETLNLALRSPRWPAPRRHRKPSDFFGAFEVEVNSASQLLRALTVVQRKNNALGLVWRGHQDAEWPVDSSLTRSLRAAGRKLGEDELIAVEKFQLAAAEQWGYWPTLGEMNLGLLHG